MAVAYPRLPDMADNECIPRREGTRTGRAWAGARIPGRRGGPVPWERGTGAFPDLPQRV